MLSKMDGQMRDQWRIKVPAILAGLVVTLSANGFAQEAPRVAIINIQAAIANSKAGQEAAQELREKFAPKRDELENQQREISDLQNQLRTQERALSDEARARLLRTLDDKTRRFNRDNEDATAEFQQAEQDAINGIGREMLEIISDHAQKNELGLVLDVSSPQTPVLYASAGIDVTQEIIDMYNAAKDEAAAAAAEAAASAAAAESSPQPPENLPASTP